MVYSIGIDVAKDSLHAHLLHMNSRQQCRPVGERTFDNRPGGFEQLQAWIRRHTDLPHPIRLVMEASGAYHERAAMALQTAGWYVSVMLPSKARFYSKSLGQASKTDGLDAKGLARMAAQRRLPRWEGIKRFWRELRAMTRHKQQLAEMATEVGNRTHASGWSVGSPKMVGRHRRQLAEQLEQQQAEIRQQIVRHLQSRPEIWEKVEGLEAIKGLSVQAIAVLLAETDGFEPFTSEGQLISYSGYDIVEQQSGQHVGPTRISKQGNARIRRILHFPAINVVSYQVPKFKHLWDRVYRRTKVKMKAYVAVQRKLLAICYHLWKKGEAFDPHYEVNLGGESHKKVAPTNDGATVDTRS